MRFPKVFLSILLLTISSVAQPSSEKLRTLEYNVAAYNDVGQYEKSITLLTDFISKEPSAYGRCQAYILKSYTYKRLFNYDETLHNLDLALQEGIHTDKQDQIVNTIKSERAFVYFDIQDYSRARQLMDELAASGFRHVPPNNKVFLIMQQGYLLMRDRKYIEAEAKLNEAIAIGKKTEPRDLPNIYGKKVELYDRMRLYDKRDEAFRTGMAIAGSYKIIKYELYLCDVMRNLLRENKDYKNALEMQFKYDSLNLIYNATSANARIQKLEQQIAGRRATLELESERSTRYFLIGLVGLLLLLSLASFFLYKYNKALRVMVEKENKRIHADVERLTKAMDEGKGIDLSNYKLTNRQLEIIELVKQGKSNKEIAAALFISENTVKYHLKIIYEILDIEHRLELVK